jgi:hypothetical protein
MTVARGSDADAVETGAADGMTVEFHVDGVVVSVGLGPGDGHLRQAAAVARARDAIARLARSQAAQHPSRRKGPSARPNVFDSWAYREE